MAAIPTPKGDKNREAIDSLRGYVYQIYQSALAWIELKPEEFLFLEVAEDYAVVAAAALNAVQVKETVNNVTINSEDIIASIDSFVSLCQKNPELQVRLRHLTTSKIGKEKSAEHRIGDMPTLEEWRKLAKAGDLAPLRKILNASKLSEQTKKYISELDDTEFREGFLKRIHFDCGVLNSEFLIRQLRSKLLQLVVARGGVDSQVDGCLNSILMTLLRKAAQKTERFVDRNELEGLIEKATHLPVNLAQFERQTQLVNKALAASLPQAQGSNQLAVRLEEPKPIQEVPFPTAIASRSLLIDNILSSLTQYGVSWIFGAAGVGKTTAARIAARRLGGSWAGINLRNLDAEQAKAVLSSAIDWLGEQKIDGLLVDDLECSFEPYLVDTLLYLHAICNRTDLLLLFTSPKSPCSDFLFPANLQASIGQKIEEFSEQDIYEILAGLGVQNNNWVHYIHLISGGGHPQLAVAAIQNMQSNGWYTNELKTLDSLFVGNPAIDQVRARTRERLLKELPEGGRRLLERLSLKVGGFRRSFVLDMAQVAPAVPDGGIIFDRLIGSWVDQQERDRFALSPLLSNLAANTLTEEQKQKINFEIANSLIKANSLTPFEVDSAMIAALLGKNTRAIIYLCILVLRTSQNELKMIAPHLKFFTFMRTDSFAYEDDPAASQMFRGAQLLLLCQEEESREKIQEALDCFDAESERVQHDGKRTAIMAMVYEKILISTIKSGAIPSFLDLVSKLNVLLENKDKTIPQEIIKEIVCWEKDNVPTIGFVFLMQVQQLRQIKELIPVFEFINSCEQQLRNKLLRPYSNPELNVDMLVSSAWLKEYAAGTIDPPNHSAVFAQLEKFANSWGNNEIAVSCRKFRVIIIDEYGGDKNYALAILDEGMKLYGETNSELVRAKAKVLYRADDHQASLELSKVLIEGDAPLNETEKAFLGREAAISAENQGDYETARRYYLYGSNAAEKCKIPKMEAMRVGLLADAALASWQAGNRETCLHDLVTVLRELKNIDPKSCLRAAHCHALCRHILLWLDQDVTGEKRQSENGEELKIYPGIVSNPEPHPKIGERYILPIEMAWYLLAVVENHSCLDVGVTKNLGDFLPNGPVFEGQFVLTASKMKKAFMMLDPALFVDALRETVAEFAYSEEQGGYKKSFNIEEVTYGLIPAPTLEQQAGQAELAEQLVLCFGFKCIFVEDIAKLEKLINLLEEGQRVKMRKDFLDSLRGNVAATDYYNSLTALLAVHKTAVDKNDTLLPTQIFELALRAAQLEKQTNNVHSIAEHACKWLDIKWNFICEKQRFLLKHPSFYEKNITQVCTANYGS